MTCPECRAAGQTSRVYPDPFASTTLMGGEARTTTRRVFEPGELSP
jgi:hypothetical protein